MKQPSSKNMGVRPDSTIPAWAMEMADVAVRCAKLDPGVRGNAGWLEETLRGATHVHAQNVADYFWLDSPREQWDLSTHIASARCPWKTA